MLRITPIFPATTTLSRGHLKKGERNYLIQGTFENKKVLIKTILASNLLCIFNCTCQWNDTENVVFTPNSSEDKEEIAFDLEQLTTSSLVVIRVHLSRKMRISEDEMRQGGQSRFQHGSEWESELALLFGKSLEGRTMGI